MARGDVLSFLELGFFGFGTTYSRVKEETFWKETRVFVWAFYV